MDAEKCIISIMKGFGDYLDNGHIGLEWRQGPPRTGTHIMKRQLAFVPPSQLLGTMFATTGSWHRY